MTRLHDAVAEPGFGKSDPERHGVVVLAVTSLIQGLSMVTRWSPGEEPGRREAIGHVVRAAVLGLALEPAPVSPESPGTR